MNLKHDIRKLQIGKWYKAHNIIFMPKKYLEKHPYAESFGRKSQGALIVIWMQAAYHIGSYVYNEKMLFEIHEKYRNDKLIGLSLYNSATENDIDSYLIEEAEQDNFHTQIRGVLELKNEKDMK